MTALDVQEQPAMDGGQLDQLLTELAADADPDARLRRVHEAVAALAFSASRAVAQQWRDKIVAAGYIGRQDWREVFADARQRVDRARRMSQREQPAEQMHIEGDDGCLYLSAEAGRVLLARFVPRVVGEVTRDDGAEQAKVIRVRVCLPTGVECEVDVPAERMHQARRWADRMAAPVLQPPATSRSGS